MPINWLNSVTTRWIDSGVDQQTPETDVKYIRFLNATLLLFGISQLPILGLLIGLELWGQLPINVIALALC